MVFLLASLIVIGSPSASTADQGDLRRSGYELVANGWRRTNRGWEDTASWDLLLAGTSVGAIALRPEGNFATIAVDRLSTIHPLVVASVQFAGVLILLIPGRIEKRSRSQRR